MNPMEEDKVVWNWKTVRKGLLWVVGLLVPVLVVLYIFGGYGDIRYYLARKNFEKERQKNEAENARLEALAKVDIYGGKTPEETLDLYISALKKGDIELASRYHRVDQWEEALSDLKEAQQKDNLTFAITFATDVRDNGVKMCKKDGCTIQYDFITEKEETFKMGSTGDTLTIPAGSKDNKSIDFEINSYTKVWKIVEP